MAFRYSDGVAGKMTVIQRISREGANTVGLMRWGLRFGRKLGSMAPGPTVAVVVTTIVAQVAFIIAFFLPVKILFLLEGTRVPRYFPDFLLDYPRNDLIVYMASIALGSFVIYSLLRRVKDALVDRGAQRVVAATKKLDVVRNQDRQVRRAYAAYSTVLANVFFIALSVVLLFFIYRLVFFVLVGLLAAVVVMFVVISTRGDRFRQNFLDRVGEFFRVTSNIGFLIVFVTILADYLTGGGPNLIIALISILFARQSLSKLPRVAKSVLTLFGKRNTLDALFAKGQPLVAVDSLKKNGFARVVVESAWEAFAAEILNQLDPGDNRQVVSVHWSESSRYRVNDFLVSTDDGSRQETLIVRVFHPRAALQAKREHQILTAGIEGLPAPPLEGVAEHDGLLVHVLNVTGFQPHSGDKTAASEAVLGQLLRLEPPAPFITTYTRSTPLRIDTISRKGLTRAATVAKKSGWDIPDQCLERIREDIGVISRQPLMITNRNVGHVNTWIDQSGQCVLVHWGQWSLSYVGEQRPPSRRSDVTFSDTLQGSGRSSGDAGESEPTVARAQLLSAFAVDLQNKEFGLAAKKLQRLCRGETGGVRVGVVGDDDDDDSDEDDDEETPE